jgi:hypothetical protein
MQCTLTVTKGHLRLSTTLTRPSLPTRLKPEDSKLFRFHGIAGFQPGIETAEERVNVREAMATEYLRHTSARRLIGSCAIGDNGPVTGNLMQMAIHLISRHANRPRHFHR